LPAVFEREDFLDVPEPPEVLLPVEVFLEAEPLDAELPDFLEAVLEELFLEAVFFDAAREEDFELVFPEAPDELLVEVLEDVFLGAAFFEADFPDAFFEAVLLPDDPDFLGTLSPFSLASESPMAIACLRDVTFFPLRPLFNFPWCISCMVFSTFFPAPFEYLAI
jgi:hypothetical protein